MNGRWVTMHLPEEAMRGFENLLPGLRACIDDEGEIWAWCGLIQDRTVALMLASGDEEPFLFDGGEEYLRLSWMRENLAIDETGKALADLVEKRVKHATFS